MGLCRLVGGNKGQKLGNKGTQCITGGTGAFAGSQTCPVTHSCTSTGLMAGTAVFLLIAFVCTSLWVWAMARGLKQEAAQDAPPTIHVEVQLSTTRPSFQARNNEPGLYEHRETHALPVVEEEEQHGIPDGLPAVDAEEHGGIVHGLDSAMPSSHQLQDMEDDLGTTMHQPSDTGTQPVHSRAASSISLAQRESSLSTTGGERLIMRVFASLGGDLLQGLKHKKSQDYGE